MIELEHLSKIYRTPHTETIALDDVSLCVNEKEFVAVMGPSGCGKSTLLNIVGMIDVPTQGSYRFGGAEIGSCSENELVELRRRNVGFIFQNFNLIDALTVQENVELPLLYLNESKKQRRMHAREALELVGLSARARHRPQELSGGQQQRVAIARAVVADPRLILADEPTGNLDTSNGAEVMQMLQILREQGATVLMVTHSPAQGAEADRVIEMLDGRVVDTLPDTEAVETLTTMHSG